VKNMALYKGTTSVVPNERWTIGPYGLRKKGKSGETDCMQGLKALNVCSFTARLKSCPDTKHEFFPQLIKPFPSTNSFAAACSAPAYQLFSRRMRQNHNSKRLGLSGGLYDTTEIVAYAKTSRFRIPQSPCPYQIICYSR